MTMTVVDIAVEAHTQMIRARQALATAEGMLNETLATLDDEQVAEYASRIAKAGRNRARIRHDLEPKVSDAETAALADAVADELSQHGIEGIQFADDGKCPECGMHGWHKRSCSRRGTGREGFYQQ